MVYAFYPCRSDGSSIAFDLMDFPDDATALAYAPRVLNRHDSAIEVVIWAGERRLDPVGRTEAARVAAE